MFWIAIIMAGSSLILLFAARKEAVPLEGSTLLKPFLKMSQYLLKRIWQWFPKLFSSTQVMKDLTVLHPGEAKEYLQTTYYVRKTALCLAVVWGGTLFGAAVAIGVKDDLILGENGEIARWEYQEGRREINIVADYGETQMNFRIQVDPRQLTEEEAKKLFEKFLKNLPELVLNGNESLEHITTDLSLEEEYEGFPIVVEWESRRQEVVTNTGHVLPVEKEEQVELSVRLKYGEYVRQEAFFVVVIPPVLSEEERIYREMEELLIQSHDESLEQEKWLLPAQLRGISIHWRQLMEDNSLLVWAASVVVAALVYLFSDRDLHGQIEKRKKSLRWEYPEIVHKLVLFVGAGMTIRGAFQKIAGDYETKHGGREKMQPAYEEMLYTCRELHGGVSEGASYEHFGRRTGLQEYIRLCTLLTQNLKRGNRTLLERLREEADKAAEEQLQQGRKLGEEAGTKLLIPMVLMLAVVMVVIMIPAFSNI